MTFQATSKPILPHATDLIAAAASAAGVDPKDLAAANRLIEIATQLRAGDGAAGLASIGAALLAQAKPELAMALELMQKVTDPAAALANISTALLAQAPPEVAMALDLFQKANEFSAQIPGCFGGVGIADHPQFGQLPLDFCSPIPTFMPCGVDPAASSAPLRGIKFDDKNRLLRFYSPLSGEKTLLIDSFKGTAALSKPFHFTLQLLSENACIPLKEMIARNVTVAIRLADGSDSYINGYVDCFGCERADGGFAFYEAEVVPWFSFLDKRINSRIYQDITVLGVIESVFADYKQIAKYAFRTAESYEPESYIVQYDETDEHFVSRLMEKNGLFYYFEHGIDGHVMVISDDSCNVRFCPALAAHPEAEFNAGNRAQQEDGVTAFAARRKLHASRVTLNTFDFKSPHGQRIVEGDTIAQQGDVPFLEAYDGSPSFAYRNRAHGDREARRRLQEMEWQGKKFSGESDCRGFLPGHTFKLLKHHWFDDYDASDNDFLLVAVEYEARNNYFGKGTHAVYRNEFVAIRRKIPYRPRLEHKPPRMAGPQTAIVVGPEGAEIHTDKFGRVKVQFHWDRYGKHDESSSCWVRVSQPLAGQGYGMIAIPRVGQEVVIEFLDGRCDRPIVTGRVYNADQSVPYQLPEAANIIGLRSRATPGGGGFNEVALHDGKGKELVSIHAQRDMFTSVGESQMTVVNGKDQTVHVTQGEQFTLVRKNIDISSEIGGVYLSANTELIIGAGLSRMRFRPDGIIELQGKMINAAIDLSRNCSASPVVSSAGAKRKEKDDVVDLGDGRFKLPNGRIVRPTVVAEAVTQAGNTAPVKSGSDRRLFTNVLDEGVYADNVGQVFHGLARHTRHVAQVPEWMRPADGHPITYTFDSTGEPFWNLGGGKLAGIPIPFARPHLSDLQANALWNGISDGLVETPGALVDGVSDLVHGRLSLNQFASGLYENSPVGWLAAMKDDDAYAAGRRAVGATTGLAMGYGLQAGAGAAARGYGSLMTKVDELAPDVGVSAFPQELSRGAQIGATPSKSPIFAEAINAADLPARPDFIATSNGDIAVLGGLGPRKILALERELKVAELTGGRSAVQARYTESGRLILEDTPIINTRGVSGIDVFGKNGELIQVGGPGKNANPSVLAKTKNALEVLKEEARLRQTTAQVYLEKGDSARFSELVSEAKRILGDENVFIFSL